VQCRSVCQHISLWRLSSSMLKVRPSACLCGCSAEVAEVPARPPTQHLNYCGVFTSSDASTYNCGGAAVLLGCSLTSKNADQRAENFAGTGMGLDAARHLQSGVPNRCTLRMEMAHLKSRIRFNPEAQCTSSTLLECLPAPTAMFSCFCNSGSVTQGLARSI